MMSRRRWRSDRRKEALNPPGPAEAMDGVRVRWPHAQFPNSRRSVSLVSGSPAARRGRGERKRREREQFNGNKNFNADYFKSPYKQ
jgi:hypothetical protein